jgi:hypothetical protein
MSIDIFKPTLLLTSILVLGGCDRVMYTPSCSSVGPADYGSRFTTLRNGVISDSDTDLSWYRCPFGTNYNELNTCLGSPVLLPLQDAQLVVEETARKSSVTWRLPTIKEFQTILREDCENPALDPGLFPGSLSENHWTSDNFDPESSLGCAVYSYQGSSSCRLKKDNLFPFMIVTDQVLNSN